MIKMFEQNLHNVQHHGELTEEHNPVALGVHNDVLNNKTETNLKGTHQIVKMDSSKPFV